MTAIQFLEIAYRNRVDQIGNHQVNEESEGITIKISLNHSCNKYCNLIGPN